VYTFDSDANGVRYHDQRKQCSRGDDVCLHRSIIIAVWKRGSNACIYSSDPGELTAEIADDCGDARGRAVAGNADVMQISMCSPLCGLCVLYGESLGWNGFHCHAPQESS
jgi:hypothetical protein